MRDPITGVRDRFHRAGIAFRWRPEKPCSADDLVRLVHESDCTLVVIASAGEDGFSTCWAPGSRLLLDLFLSGWRSAVGVPRARLEAGMQCVRERYLNEARRLDKYVPEDDLGGPHGEIAAVAIARDDAVGSWIGTDIVLSTGAYTPSWATSPHDLRSELIAKGLEIPPGPLPDVLVRCIADSTDAAPDFASTVVRVGDAFVVANSYVHRRLGADSMAFIASVSTSPQEAADDMVRLAYDEGNAPCAAACVVRVEDIDFSPRIRELIGAFSFDGRDRESLERYARTHELLPLVFDMGGAFGIGADGRIRAVGWDDLDKPPAPFRHLGAILHARQRLVDIASDLECVAPRRPPNAAECARCSEWRAAISSSGRGCPFCSYLGWMPPEIPQGIARTLYADAREAPRALPPSKTAWWQFWKRNLG